MNSFSKLEPLLKIKSNSGFILLSTTIALFIILSIFSLLLIRIVVKENQTSNYNIADIKTRNLVQSGLDHGIQVFKNIGSPYLSPITKNFNNGQYTITYDPSNNENGSTLPYSHFAMIKTSASLSDATRNSRLFVSSYPDAFNLAFFGNRNGIPWKALSFDGNDQVVVPDNTTLRITGPLTVEAWFRVTTHTNDWIRIVGKGSSGPRNYGLWIHQNGTFLFQQYGSGDHTNAAYNAPIQTNQWYHIAGVRKASGSSDLYVDGQLRASDNIPVTTPATSSDPLTFGYAGFHQYFRGQIDEVKIWNIARTQSEIQSSLYSKLSGNEQGLVGYWDFNENSGNVAYDKTGNSNDANRNTAEWITIDDPYTGSFTQSGGVVNGDIYYNGNISSANLNGTAYTSTGSGGTLHPEPLPEFPLANTTYFSAILDTISPAMGSGGSEDEDEDEVTGQIVSVTGTKDRKVSGSVFPSYEVNYLCCGMVYWWEVKVEFQPVGSNTTFIETYGENTRNSTRPFTWSIKDHVGNATQVIVKNIWIRGDFAAGSEYLDNVTIGGHNFGRMNGVGDDGVWDIEYAHDGSDGESTCEDCLALVHGENSNNSTRSWTYNLDGFNSASTVIIKSISVRGDFSASSEYLDNVTVGGHNFGRMQGVGDDGVWDRMFDGNKVVTMGGTTVSASVFPSIQINYAPGGSPNWWQLKVEFYQEPEPEGGGPLELTNNFNLNSTYPNGLYYGNDISMTGLTVSGSGKIYATGNIDITNCTIAGGVEIASSGKINISNSNLGSNVNSMSNSIVLFSRSGLNISGSNVRGLILNQGTDLNISNSSNVKGALYTCSNVTDIISSTITGSVVSKYGVNLNNSIINKGSLPPTYGLSYGFDPMIIPGSYLEY